MRRVVVLPQPDGPSRQKNSPSRTVNVESRTATKSPNALCRFSIRISAMRYFGNFETTVNISVPARVVMNEWVYRAMEKGCSSMSTPATTMTVASCATLRT